MSAEMPKYFLDSDGVTYLWSEIEKRFINVDELKAVIDTIDAVKADKDDIPSTLPANGGNADSLGGYMAEDYVRVDSDVVYIFNCGTSTKLID